MKSSKNRVAPAAAPQPATLDEALTEIRSAAVDAALTPVQVRQFFVAGYVAAQLLGAVSDKLIYGPTVPHAAEAKAVA